MNCLLILPLFALLCSGVVGAPTATKTDAEHQVLKYLVRYGYLEKEDLYNRARVADAINKLQGMANITQTGIIDGATIEFTKRPRCGVPDYEKGGHRYQVYSPWTKKHLTYSINLERVGDGLTEKQYVENVQWAFSLWLSYAPTLRATRVYNESEADIVIAFVEKEHGDGYPFDGPVGFLAHAFFPQIGDVHFDLAENWDLGGNDGRYDFYSVAIHELGHSLGLGHSTVPKAIMYPAYDVRHIPHRDDIDGIFYLYL